MKTSWVSSGFANRTWGPGVFSFLLIRQKPINVTVFLFEALNKQSNCQRQNKRLHHTVGGPRPLAVTVCSHRDDTNRLRGWGVGGNHMKTPKYLHSFFELKSRSAIPNQMCCKLPLAVNKSHLWSSMCYILLLIICSVIIVFHLHLICIHH